MLKLLICGATGKTGKITVERAKTFKEVIPFCGIATKKDFSKKDFPVYARFADVKEKPDVIIDFSSPSALEELLSFAEEKRIPAVLCVTGYSDEQQRRIKRASEKIAIFKTDNTALGVYAFIKAAQRAAKLLKNFDAEIIEIHHKLKKDAPSGTAKALAKAVEAAKGNIPEQSPIKIHSLRCGNVVGEHKIIFSGEDETVIIEHRACDKKIFATGAIRAAIFLADKKSGWFCTTDLYG